MFNTLKLICVTLATGLGIGFIVPIGQGTLAAVVASVLLPWYLNLGWQVQVFFVICGAMIGVVVAQVTESLFAQKDDHRIVIDEIVSVFITFFMLRISSVNPTVIIFGLFLNRLFDWWKPFGIRKLQSLHGGVGIMIDDIMVGILTNILLRITFPGAFLPL